MKFKMTNEQIDEINQLLETNGNSLTAFYDEGHYYGKVNGIIIGTLVGVAVSNICWIAKTIKDHKDHKDNKDHKNSKERP